MSLNPTPHPNTAAAEIGATPEAAAQFQSFRVDRIELGGNSFVELFPRAIRLVTGINAVKDKLDWSEILEDVAAALVRRMQAGEDLFLLSGNSRTSREHIGLAYGLSRRTEALDEAFLRTCLDQRKSLLPEQIYNDLLLKHPGRIERTLHLPDGTNRLGDARFQFDHYASASDSFDYYAGVKDPGGKIGFLLLAEVAPTYRSAGLGPLLIHDMVEHYRTMRLNYVFAVARLMEYRERCPDPQQALGNLQTYVTAQRSKDGLHPDLGIRLHQRAGGTVICGLPFASIDAEAHHHGALVIYDLGARAFQSNSPISVSKK